MRPTTLVLLALLGVAPPAMADAPLSPEQLARIQLEEQAALAKVAASFGNRPSTELSQEERREYIRRQEEALAGVYERNGVSAKDYARQSARMSREEAARVAAAREALAERARQAPSPAPASEEPPPVQRGISEESPVVLEETPGAAPGVEYGTGESAASEGEEAVAAPEAEAPAPERKSRSKKAPSKKRRRR